MPNYTKHYNFIKPNKTENYDIEDVTTKNMDILDEELFGKEDKVPGKGPSTNDFTNEYKNKLDRLENYDDTELINKLNEQAQKNNLQEQEIEKLQIQITNLQEENTQLENQIPTGKANGNPIHITDSSNMPLSFKLNGGSRQESRSGYNKLNIEDYTNVNGITIKDSNSTSITLEAQLASDYQYEETMYFINANLELGKTYTIKAKMDILSGNTFSNTGQLELYMDGAWKQVLLTGSTSSYDKSATFTIDETGNYRIRLKLANAGLVTEKFTIKFSDFMIYEGTEEKPYEQYGAMPSPNYPSQIETVGSNVNLSEINALEIEQYSSNPTNVTGYIEISKLPVTIQFEQNNNEKYLGWIRYYDENKSLLNQVQKSNSLDIGKGFTITESYDNAKYVAYTIRGTENTNTFPLKISKIKTEQGENKTPYSPYNQGSVEIKKINKNFINLQEKTTEWSGATITRNKNKITFTGGSNGTSAMNYTCEEINLKLKAGINLTYSSKYIKGNYTGGQTYYNIKLFYSDGTSEMLQMYRNYTDVKADKIVKKTLSKDLISYYIYGSTYEVKGLTTELVYEFQLEIGNEATEIVESESQTKILPIQEEMLEGDYIEDVEHHGWGKYVFTGDETFWEQSNTIENTFKLGCTFLNDSLGYENTETAEVLCSRFKVVSAQEQSAGEKNTLIVNNGKGFIFLIDSNIANSVNEFKLKLAEWYQAGEPLIVYYKLATPIDLELTEEQEEAKEGLNTYKNITNISVDNELATLDLTYKKDLETLINNLTNVISSLTTTNEEA